MPNLADHPSHTSVKLMVASNSGTGKTGGLASLADAGYKLFILDFDNGVSTLRGYLKNKDSIANIFYIPLNDSFKLAGKKIGVVKAEAFSKAMKILSDGTDEWGVAMPALEDWPADCILVVDTLSTMGRSALAHVMKLDAKAMGQPEIQHYGVAMENIENFLGMITSDAVACSVIVNTHLMQNEGDTRMHPEALGSKLPPKVGKYFDNLITIGLSGGTKKYKTKQDGAFACKTAIPMDDSYDLPTGMLKIFEKLMKG